MRRDYSVCVFLFFIALKCTGGYKMRSHPWRAAADLFATNREPLSNIPLASPSSVQEMMVDAARAVAIARANGVPIALIEVPIPVTGGTELDDWPGGIKQKYSVLRPMLIEMMKTLGFDSESSGARNYVGGENSGGMEDAVGIWNNDDGITLCCFATIDSAPFLLSLTKEKILDFNSSGTATQDPILVIVNQQLFLEGNVVFNGGNDAKKIMSSAQVVYLLKSLNMKGPGTPPLPIRGILYRQYPGPFKVGRRLDGARGSYVEIAALSDNPPQNVLDDLFFEDSKERDKDLSFVQRLFKQVPNL